MNVVGYVTRRRCFGKKLTFADILVEEVCGDETGSESIRRKETIQVAFRFIHSDTESETAGSDMAHDTNANGWESFPQKKSDLPYGSLVSLILKRAMLDHQDTEPNSEKQLFDVQFWKFESENPRVTALESSKQDDGYLYSSYLKSRGLNYLQFNDNESMDLQSSGTNKQQKVKSSIRPTSTSGEVFSHGNNKAKATRAKIFASFLLETYGREELASGLGVLDVAGGKGQLSIELAVQGQVPCTIVDPMIRKHGQNLVPKEAKRIRKASAPHPAMLSREFNSNTFVNECSTLLDEVSALVGLHADQPTEDILDVALQQNKNIAIVPCCVFPGFFPLRTLPCGTFVKTYEQFLDYLLLKDPRLKRAELPFEGRNVVIYLVVE